MKTIGITGGVGAGKSTILDFLSKSLNSRIIMADDLAKDLCKKGECCFAPLVEILGLDVLDESGEIDKKKMAAKIFSDNALLGKVNLIIHPRVKEFIINYIEECKEKELCDFLFIEAALLIEDGYKEIVDELWYIYADEGVRRERLKASRGYSDEKIDSILKSQLSDDDFRRNSDFVIDNSGNSEDSIKQIRVRIGEIL